MDYTKLSIQELEAMAETLRFEIAELDMLQNSYKLRNNSVFGCMGNPFFRLYDIRVATAITSDGQSGVKNVERSTNKWLSDKTGVESDYVIGIDTDSVVGDTIINVNGNDIPIAEFFDESLGYQSTVAPNNLVKRVYGEYLTDSVDMNTGDIVKSRIVYAKKHLVKKEMYRVTVGDKSVIMTCDHGCIVLRDGKLIDITPNNVCIDTDTMVFTKH